MIDQGDFCVDDAVRLLAVGGFLPIAEDLNAEWCKQNVPKAKIEVDWERKQLEETKRLDEAQDVRVSVKAKCVCESTIFPRWL